MKKLLNSMKINGTLVITKWADPTFKTQWTDASAAFFKAELVIQQPAE